MKLVIRHQISDLEEEIYEFSVKSYGIKYTCFWLSKRKSLDEPFGYDWSEYYKDQRKKELDDLDSIYDDYDPYSRKQALEDKIRNKYNPIMHNLLSGSSGPGMHKEHPLKITKNEIIQAAIQKIKELKII